MLKQKKQKKLQHSEFLFALYFVSSSLLKPLWGFSFLNSTLVLLGVTALILFAYLLTSNFRFNKNNFLRLIVFISVVCGAFVLDYFVRFNSLLSSHFMSFLIKGIVPLLLLINVSDYKKVLRYWSILTSIVGILFLIDPFMEYQWTGNYMVFGFEVMLPAFAGSMIMAMYFKNKKFYILMVTFFTELFIFANKGAILTAIGLLFVVFLFFSREKIKATRVILTCGVVGIIYASRLLIVNFMFLIAKKLSVSSYALITFRQILTGDSDRVLNPRVIIWEKVLPKFLEHPLFGGGIGGFRAWYGGYPHNIFFEIVLSFGIVGLMLFLVFLVKSVFVMLKIPDGDKKFFMVVLFVLWLIPMLVSLTLWEYMPFWCYWGCVICSRRMELNF